MFNPQGSLFPESVVRGRKRKNIAYPLPDQNSPSIYLRLVFFITVLLLGLTVLLVRLFNLTVVQGSEFQKLSQENRVKERYIIAPRGIIYDRNHNPLVRNIPVYVTQHGDLLFDKSQSNNLDLIEASTREYIYDGLFAHTIGFTGEVSPSDLTEKAPFQDRENDYELGDMIGKYGIEKYYDSRLRGIDGKELVEVDARGKKIRTLGRIDPVSGKNITLTLDKDLQATVSEKMQDVVGAVVVSDPATGEILALYSSPSFDANKIIRGTDFEAIFTDSDKPLFNRAISGQYPPGSTFKIITAIAGLESGAVTAQTSIEDTGVITVGKFSYANWYFSQYGRKEGQVNIVNALKRSNDIFFYKAGELVGISELAKWGRLAGVGKILGIDLEGEEKGLMPDPAWQEKVKGESWYLGNTYHTAIGQGDVLTTPLQVNSLTNIIANGGRLCRPYLLADKKVECNHLKIKEDTIDVIREGLKLACSPGGTGWPLFNFRVNNKNLVVDGINYLPIPVSSTSAQTSVEIPTACKTGTAEFGDPQNKTHAWITVFAPINDAQISVTVLVEKGGEGSSIAGPIASDILKFWFER